MHSGNHILQPNYFILQPSGLSFAFIPREQSQWTQCYSRNGKALSYSKAMVQSKVRKILSQAREIWG